MLKHLLIFVLLILSLQGYAQVINLTPYLGHWESTEDKKNHIYITEKYVIEKYDNALIDTFSYTVTHIPCDTNYLKPGADTSAFFFLETDIHEGYNYCFEVLSNGENNHLTLRYVFNGYLNEFDRVKD